MSAEAVAKLRVLFDADSSALDKAFGDVNKKAQDSVGIFGKVTGALGSIGLAGMGVGVIKDVVGGVAGSFGDLIGKAESLGDATARVSLVFADYDAQAAEIVKENAQVANSLGMTKTAYLDSVGAIGQFVTNLGVGQEAAFEMSMGLTELAPKLAAFAGVDTEQAMNALQKGVGGATRGLKELGIAIPEIPKGLDEAGQAAFIYAQILEQSANAQAAWADNSGDVEVSMQRVSAAIEETKTALGEKLLPLIAPIAEQFASVLPGALETLVGAVGPVVDAFVTNLVPAISTAVDNVKAFIADLKSKWDSDWGGIRSAVEDVMDWWEDNVEPIITEDLQSVNDAIGGFASDWDGTWKGKIEPAVRAFIDFWKSTVAPAITLVLELWRAEIQIFAAVIEGLSAAWERHGDKIMAVVGPVVSFVMQQFQFLMDFLRGIVEAGLALLRGDWEGFGAALGKILAASVNSLAAIFRGVWNVAKTALQWAWDKIKSFFTDEGKKSGDNVSKGLVDGIKSGAGKVYQALKDLASGMIKGFMDNLKIGSPSKVFEELGMWIDAGLAAGIDKYDVKAIESMAKIVQAIASMASGLPDAMKKLAEASIPDDATIAQMEAQFDRMLGIVEKFVKRLSIRAVILGTGGNSDKAPADVKEWLRSAGIDPGSLLNNSDVTNVGRLLDATQKVIGTWSQIVDTINKVADMKPLAAGAFEEVERRSDDLIAAAERLARKYESTLIVGLTDMATAVKAAAEILSTSASLDLSKATEVTADQMRIAGANLLMAGQWAYAMVTDWLKTAGDEKTRKAWIDSLKDFADTVRAATDILKAGDVGDLSELTEVTADQLRILGANILMAGQWAYTMVTDWLKTAPDHATRQKWIEDMRDFADTIGAAVDIAKASVIGELKSAIIINLDDMKAVLIFVRDQLAPAVEEIVKAWGRATEDAKAATEQMQGFAGWIGAAVNIAKASVVGELHANILINGEVMQAILVWMRDTFAPAMQAIADQWSMTVEAAKPITEKMKAFADWVSAATGIAKAAVVGELHANILVNFDVMKAILAWMRDTFVPAIQEVVDLWGETAESAKPLVEKMKAFASIIGAAASVAKAADVGDLAKVTSPADMGARLAAVKANVLALFGMMKEIAAVIEVEEAKARADLAEAIGRASKGMADFGGGIGGLMELAQSKLFGSDVGNAARGPLSHAQRTRGRRADFFATQLADTVKRAVTAVQDALSGITLTVDDAKVEALAKLGDAFGRIADGLTKLAESKMPDAEQLAAIMGALSGAQQGMGGLAGAGGGTGAGGPMTLNLSNPSLVFSTPITASVQVTTNPVIQIGTRTIETLATIIESKLAERFTIGAGGGGSPITTGSDNFGRGHGQGKNDVNPNRRGWG